MKAEVNHCIHCPAPDLPGLAGEGGATGSKAAFTTPSNQPVLSAARLSTPRWWLSPGNLRQRSSPVDILHSAQRGAQGSPETARLRCEGRRLIGPTPAVDFRWQRTPRGFASPAWAPPRPAAGSAAHRSIISKASRLLGLAYRSRRHRNLLIPNRVRSKIAPVASPSNHWDTGDRGWGWLVVSAVSERAGHGVTTPRKGAGSPPTSSSGAFLAPRLRCLLDLSSASSAGSF